MDMKEIKEMTREAILEKIVAFRRAMLGLRCRTKVGEESGSIHEPRRIRRDIARLKTELSARCKEGR